MYALDPLSLSLAQVKLTHPDAYQTNMQLLAGDGMLMMKFHPSRRAKSVKGVFGPS
jgi:hypothetical protein